MDIPELSKGQHRVLIYGETCTMAGHAVPVEREEQLWNFDTGEWSPDVVCYEGTLDELRKVADALEHQAEQDRGGHGLYLRREADTMREYIAWRA